MQHRCKEDGMAVVLQLLCCKLLDIFGACDLVTNIRAFDAEQTL